jgi:hypothetical protein
MPLNRAAFNKKSIQADALGGKEASFTQAGWIFRLAPQGIMPSFEKGGRP